MAMSPYIGGISFPGYSPDYQGAWQGSRDLSQSLVNSGLGLYNQASSSLFGPGGWGAIPGQYSNLSNAVLGRLRGANRTNVRDIADKFTNLSGQMAQDLINRGLGNSTIQQSMQTGLAGREAREVTASRNSFANLLAQYQSQIGLAGLQAQQNALSAQQSFAGTGLGFLSGINVGYPDRGSYMSAANSGGGSLAVGYGRPTGGYGPQGAGFGPQPTPVDYGGGGGGGMGGWATGYGGPSWNVAPGGVSSGAGVGYSGEYYPSYAASPQESFVPNGGGYGMAEAVGYE